MRRRSVLSRGLPPTAALRHGLVSVGACLPAHAARIRARGTRRGPEAPEIIESRVHAAADGRRSLKLLENHSARPLVVSY